MEEIDIWQTAEMLVSRHGSEQAAPTTSMRADELRDQDDVEGCYVWK